MTCFRVKTGETLRKYCKNNGLKYSTLYTRLDKKGLTPEEALQTDTRKYGCHTLKDGKTLREACTSVGIPYTTVLNRVYTGKETLQEAFDFLYERRMKRVKLFGRNA